MPKPTDSHSQAMRAETRARIGFVSQGIDHAGLLALRVPHPTMLGTAVRDFFPIEGARESFDEVKRLYERFGDQITVYPQFSQYVIKDDPRRHRVVHMNYRVGKRDLSYPRPQVDLTTRAVVVPAPEAEPKTSRPRRGGTN